MKKRAIAAFMAAAVAASALTGCQSSKPAETTEAETTAAETTAAETTEAETTEAEKEADKPFEGTTLNVMLAYGGADASFDAFTEKTGIKVEYVEISTGKALAQLQAENGNTTADVWFGGGVATFPLRSWDIWSSMSLRRQRRSIRHIVTKTATGQVLLLYRQASL